MGSNTSNPLKTMARAFDFAARKHLSSGHDATAALLQLSGVSRLLAEVTDGKDRIIVAAGILSGIAGLDQSTLDDIEERFGREIAAMAAEAVLPPLSEPNQRLLRARALSPEAGLILLARFIAKLMEFQRQKLPAKIDRRLDRLEDMARIANALRGTRHLLGATFHRALAAHLAQIAESCRAGDREPEPGPAEEPVTAGTEPAPTADAKAITSETNGPSVARRTSEILAIYQMS